MSRFSPYWLWALLSAPAVLWTWVALTSSNPRIIHILVHPTGEMSARLLIVTMLATPLIVLFKGRNWPHWLRRNRRYLGVAAFGYGALHTLFYLIDKGTLATVTGELPRVYIWTGWIAFLVFVPLAITSTDGFVKRMGRWWKPLQRLTYAAAVLTLVHWASIHNWSSVLPAVVHFGPLAALEVYRFLDWQRRRRARAVAA